LKKIGHHWGIDTAVGYAVSARVWQLLTGQLTMLLIVFCLTDVEQGYYYAFFYLLAMQIFVELGLHVVIINVASHEWSQLRIVDQRVTGDPHALSRLASLSRIAARWYLLAACVFVVAITIAGYLYFNWPTGQNPAGLSVLEWAAPWTSLVILTGLQLVLLPLSSILEGCGQLPTINKVRFWQGVAGSAVVWTMMYAGFGLWALSGSAAVRLCGETYLVRSRYGGFFTSLRDGNSGQAIDWKAEVVPLQWRIAIQGTLHWFATHLAGLVIFKCHGEAMGGRFGLMWTVLTAMQSASMAWVETRRPLFGQLIAEQNYVELDRLFFRLSRLSMILIAVGGAAFTTGVYVVNEFPNAIFTQIASRMPNVWSTAIYSVAFIALQPTLCISIYVRAHKRDPFLIPVIIASLTVAVLVFWLGSNYGIVGSGSGYLFAIAVVQTPIWVLVWYQSRKTWHTQEIQP
jgi:hypothetical protein